MKLFVTGSGGMVGRNVIENPYIKTHTLITPRSSELDLTDYNRVYQFLGDTKPDFIIHCAGKVGGIQANMNYLYEYFTENAVMGINLVRAAKSIGIKRFINLSSSCAYPRNYIQPLKEEYILRGELEPTNEGYALAKLSVLKMCEYISREYPDFQYKTLIPCNLYGKYDKFGESNSHMIPAAIRKIHDAKMAGAQSVTIWGDGNARREFLYAGDLADCIACAVQNFNQVPNLMNVGVGRDYTINEYYQIIQDVIGYRGDFTHDVSKPVGMQQKLLDISRQTKFGWRPKTKLVDGIRETYKFYKMEHTK